MILANRNAIRSACIVATVFGVISPNIRIKSVRMPVAIPTILLPQMWVARTVAREDAYRFTTLLPIRIALSILLGSSMIFNTYSACLSPFSASVRTRILLTVVSAVSAEEKKADSANSTISTINSIVSFESNDKSLLFDNCVIKSNIQHLRRFCKKKGSIGERK